MHGDIERLRGVVSGEVAIATLDSLTVQFLPAAVARFTTDHPAVQVRVTACDPMEAVHSLAQGNADLGLTFLTAWRGGVTVLCDIPSPMCAIMKPDHELASRSSVALDQCAGHRLIYQDGSSSMQLFFGATMESFKNAHEPIVVSNNLGLVKQLLLNGTGIGFYTRMGFADELAGGKLVAVPSGGGSAVGAAAVPDRSIRTHAHRRRTRRGRAPPSGADPLRRRSGQGSPPVIRSVTVDRLLESPGLAAARAAAEHLRQALIRFAADLDRGPRR